jgi:hypothetical protein
MTDTSGQKGRGAGIDRRGALECMIWAGTGVLWTLAGGVPKSLGLLGDANAAEAGQFNFLPMPWGRCGRRSAR